MDDYDRGGTFPPSQPARNGTSKPEPVYNPTAKRYYTAEWVD